MLVFFWIVLIVVFIVGVFIIFICFSCVLNVWRIVGIVLLVSIFFVVLFNIGCLLKNSVDRLMIFVV